MLIAGVVQNLSPCTSQIWLVPLLVHILFKVPIKYKLIKRQNCHHIQISQLICSANQLTGFYMMTTLAFNELRYKSADNIYT